MATERRQAEPPEHLIIEDFENDLARVEWGQRTLDLPRHWLPKGAHPGDHLTIEVVGNGRIKMTVDAAATQQAHAQNQAALDRLNASDTGGAVDL